MMVVVALVNICKIQLRRCCTLYIIIISVIISIIISVIITIIIVLYMSLYCICRVV